MVDLRNGMLAGLGVNFDTATSLTETVGPREQDRMQGLVESVLARYGVSVNVENRRVLGLAGKIMRQRNYASDA
jgi:hypothetical protein